jgi:hypothetical protein
MSYTIQVYPDKSIIWQTLGAEYDFATDVGAAIHEELQILNAASKPMVIVIDMRSLQLDWNGILFLASHGVPEEINNHPRLCKIILISTDEVVAESAKGLDSQPFGFVKLDIVASPEDALTQARKLLS